MCSLVPAVFFPWSFSSVFLFAQWPVART
jgi:hypothetical protein